MILVTGSAGYIGSHISHELYNKKLKFIGIDNFSSKNVKNKYISNTKKVDISNNKIVSNIIKKYKIKTVIHTAAHSYPIESMKNKKKYFNNNIKKTKKFIENCNKNNIENFIFLSSSNVYSRNLNRSFNEKDKIQPTNYYGKTKKYIENFLENKKYFKNLIILRLFNVVGFYDNFKYKLDRYKYRRFLTLLTENKIKNKLKINYFEKNQSIFFPKRDFIYIKDLNILILKILKSFKKKENNYQILNVGSGKATNIFQLYKEYSLLSKKRIDFKLHKLKKVELKNTLANIGKVKKSFKWKPKKNLTYILNSVINN